MGVKFFGQYLLEKNIISSDQLLQAVEYQKSNNLSIGEYAVNKKYLSLKQLLSILDYQKKTDKKFGEIAVELKILSPLQVDELLESQKKEKIYIGEALVKINALTEATLKEELALFLQEQKEYEQKFNQLPSNLKNAQVYEIFADITHKYLMRLWRVFLKRGAFYINKNDLLGDFTTTLPFINGFDLTYSISINENLAVKSAQITLFDNEIKSNDPLVADNLAETANIIGGNICSKLETVGIKCEIYLPQVYKRGEGKPYDFSSKKNNIIFELIAPHETIYVGLEFDDA